MRDRERLQTVQVRTPEGVMFAYRIASPALRLTALTIDLGAVSVGWSVLAVPVALLRIVSPDFAGWVAVVGYFVLSLGYDMASEWLWRGQTLGKRILCLRVVDARGLRLSFSQIALRNLLRFIDRLPLLYLVGGVAALANRHGQRLGDLAAGTLVIWEPPEPAPDFRAWQAGKYNSLRAHAPVVARLRQATGPAEARAAWQALQRRDELEPAARVRLFAELAGHFRTLTPIPPEAVEGVSDEQFVRNVVEVLYLSRSSA